MSLTKFISIPEVKQRFKAEFPLPTASIQGSIIAPPMTKNYGLVGTAFDYLMRFYLERLNPNCVKEPWVAEQSAELVKQVPKLYDITTTLLEFAKNSYRQYLETGDLRDDILKSVIFLAQLDVIYRAGILDPNMGEVDPADMLDLRNLFGAIEPSQFRAREVCMLNPTFGEASILVGGADADLLLDGCLIDIKTVKKLEFSRDYFNQLVGYYILRRISGRIGSREGTKITKLGIYYSRYGILHFVPTDVVERKENLPQFITWFMKRAREEYPTERS